MCRAWGDWGFDELGLYRRLSVVHHAGGFWQFRQMLMFMSRLTTNWQKRVFFIYADASGRFFPLLAGLSSTRSRISSDKGPKATDFFGG
jgi:hypothetical protein